MGALAGLNRGPLAPALDRLLTLDWDDVVQASRTVEPLLREIAGSGHLAAALDHAEQDPELRRAAEHDEFFRKVALARDPGTGISLRLHLLAPESEAVPHNHRASFAALVLAGRYEHLLYDLPRSWLDPGDDPGLAPGHRPEASTPAAVMALRPSQARVERPGSFYALHHGGVHATLVEAGHVSLVARGPSRRRRLVMMHVATGAIEWLSGSSDETDEELAAKQMTDAVFAEVRAQVSAAVGPPGRPRGGAGW